MRKKVLVLQTRVCIWTIIVFKLVVCFKRVAYICEKKKKNVNVGKLWLAYSYSYSMLYQWKVVFFFTNFRKSYGPQPFPLSMLKFIAKYGLLIWVHDAIRVFLSSQRPATFATSEELSHQLNEILPSNSRLWRSNGRCAPRLSPPVKDQTPPASFGKENPAPAIVCVALCFGLILFPGFCSFCVIPSVFWNSSTLCRTEVQKWHAKED